MKRVNVGIDKKIHMKAKVLSTIKDIPLNDFIVSSLENSIKEDLKNLDI